MTGRNNITLAEKSKEEPESYLSVACPDFPNYFIFTGPNATVGHGSLIQSLSWTSDYFIKWLLKISREDIVSIVPKQDVVDEFVRALTPSLLPNKVALRSSRAHHRRRVTEGRRRE